MLRRYLPVALTLIGYLVVLVALATYDVRATFLAMGAIAIYEGRQA